MLLGQAVGAWPIVRLFGPSIAALQLSVAAVGCVGIGLAYLCVRRLVNAKMATLAVVPLALGPLFGSLAVSFMTDIPALTLQIVAIYFSIRAIESASRSTSWWVAALIAGACAFSIREYAAATFAAVAVAAVATTEHSAQRTRRICAVALSSGAMVVLYVWRHTLPGEVDTHVHIGLSRLQHTQSYLLTLSLLLLPVCWMTSWRRLGRLILVRHKRAKVLAIVVVLLITLSIGHQQVLGNYVTPAGISSPAAVQPLLPATAWRTALVTAATAEATLVAIVVLTANASRSRRPLRSRDATEQVRCLFVSTVILGIVGQLMLIAFTDSPAWDRYLLLFLPFASALIIETARHRGLVALGHGRLPAAIAVVVYVTVGAAYTDRAAQFDGAAWRLGNRAVAAGYDPTTIDAGYAWIGYHQPGIDAWPGAPNPAFWRRPTRRRCVTLSFRQPGHRTPERTPNTVRTASPPGHPLELAATPGPDHCSPRAPRGPR